MNALRAVAIVGSLAAASGCSIERTKALNDECIQSRECAVGTCLPRADGRYVCTMQSGPGLPGMIDAGQDGASSDAFTATDADGSSDAATDVSDASPTG